MHPRSANCQPAPTFSLTRAIPIPGHSHTPAKDPLSLFQPSIALYRSLPLLSIRWLYRCPTRLSTAHTLDSVPTFLDKPKPLRQVHTSLTCPRPLIVLLTWLSESQDPVRCKITQLDLCRESLRVFGFSVRSHFEVPSSLYAPEIV